MPDPLIRPLRPENPNVRHPAAVAEFRALRNALRGRTDRPHVAIVDVAAPFASLTAAAYGALFGRAYTGPDWRLILTWPTGEQVTMHAGATAADALRHLDWREERRA